MFTVLQEMGRIIQRDFFPDLEKLRAQNAYLEAVERNDVEKLREIYAKYSSGKRPPTERCKYNSLGPFCIFFFFTKIEFWYAPTF
jgi:hypothetical protein